MMSFQEEIIYGKLIGKIPLRGVPAEFSGTAINEDLEADEVSFDILDKAILQMKATKENYAFRPIYSFRKLIGGAIVFFKRVVRKCLKWYIEPICYQQTDFNNAAVFALEQLRMAMRHMKEVEQQYQELTERILHMEEVEQQYREQYRELAEQVLHMEKVEQQYQESAKQAEADAARMRERVDHHESQIRTLIVEHNGRLDRLESRMDVLSAVTAQSSAMLDQLHTQGAFLSIAKNENVMRLSASQSGEDGIIAYILSVMGISEKNCFYLDLGANHAKYLSNTYSLYQKGAHGVLVEANPTLISELKLFRGGDVILNRCISKSSGEKIPFYILNGDGLSTPNKEEAEKAIELNPALSIVKVEQIETITVNEVLEQYFEKAPQFLNIDIEGGDLEILESIDFEKYRPLVISVETIPYRPHLVIGEKIQEIVDFMIKRDYVEYAFTGINSIFIDKRQILEVQR